MHPSELIAFIIVGGIIVSLLTVAFYFKGRWRKTSWLLALTILIAYGVFFVIRPYWIDAQIDKKVQLLKPYLELHYPDEEWTISTAPHREAGYKSLNPYYIGVVFENEPGVVYHYWVESEDHIYQISYSTDNGLEGLKHMEKRIE